MFTNLEVSQCMGFYAFGEGCDLGHLIMVGTKEKGLGPLLGNS